MSGSVSLRSWRSTVWTAVIAHGKTASRMLRRRPASKDTGATRSAKYASRNEKVWSVKWPPARKTNEIGRASCRERGENEVDAGAEDGIRDRDVTGVQTCALPICSVSLRSWRSTVWTAVIAHGKTASRMLRRRPASKDTGATRSAKYASRNEKVWSVKWPPARKTNALTPQSSGTTPL